jgi:aspartate-semialdehyde dehydrogenase
MRSLRIAVVGATGLVGRTILQILEERNFPVAELFPVASEKSVGSFVKFNGVDVEVMSLNTALAVKPDVVLLSAGGGISLEWAPKFAAQGATVIDNSSAFRMNENHKLIVPEVNGDSLVSEDLIIANPNCSTIQLVMALKPLHDKFRIIRGVVSTYQSVTGTGKAAVDQLDSERAGEAAEMIYPYRIDKNCIPQCDDFLDNGYTREEMKVHFETKKILGDDSVELSCTAVRVPVKGGHSEAVYIEFQEDFKLSEVISLLESFQGIIVENDNANSLYPMPLNSEGKDDVFVGRIRRDLTNPKGLHIWVVSDNLRKGAATNTIQIAEYLNIMGRWS